MEISNIDAIEDSICVSGESDLIEAQVAETIDGIERALLSVNKETLRAALSKHLEELSKKALLEQSSLEGEVVVNAKLYPVDGEVGRFYFPTHSVVSDGRTLFDTAQSFYRCIKGREWYKTQNFKELLTLFSVGDSFRKTTTLLNRVRHQEEDGTPLRTVQSTIKQEGYKYHSCLCQTAMDILESHNF